MTVSFYQRGNMIYARLTDGNHNYRITTGLKVLPHQKFKRKFLGNNTEIASLNNELDRIKIKLTEQYLAKGDFKALKVVDPEKSKEHSFELDDLLQKYVRLMMSGDIKSSAKRNYSQATISIYGYAAQLISQFSEYYGPLDLSECHIDGNLSVEKKMEISEYFNLFFKKFEDFLIDRGSSMKTRSDVLNMVAVMMNYWSKKYFFNLPKVSRAQADKKPIVVFPPGFVKNFLNDTKKYETLEPELKFVWEISATILITTLRISDTLSLTFKDLMVTKDNVYMNKKNQKTGMFSQMPLPKFLGNIYRENMARYGRIYCLEPTRDLVYDNIKRLFRLYDEAHDIVSISRLDPRGNEYYESKPLWEWAHPHLLRKSAITTMLFNGVPERFIKFCSGHEARSLAFEDYVGHVEKNFRNEVDNYYDKFLGSN